MTETHSKAKELKERYGVGFVAKFCGLSTHGVKQLAAAETSPFPTTCEIISSAYDALEGFRPMEFIRFICSKISTHKSVGELFNVTGAAIAHWRKRDFKMTPSTIVMMDVYRAWRDMKEFF